MEKGRDGDATRELDEVNSCQRKQKKKKRSVADDAMGQGDNVGELLDQSSRKFRGMGLAAGLCAPTRRVRGPRPSPELPSSAFT